MGMPKSATFSAASVRCSTVKVVVVPLYLAILFMNDRNCFSVLSDADEKAGTFEKIEAKET